MTRILGVIRDLVLSMKTETILKNHGHKLEYLQENINLEDYDIILVDLSDNRALDTIKKIPEKCIAFGSHIDIDLLNQARELGCKNVLPRSRFFESLSSLVKQN